MQTLVEDFIQHLRNERGQSENTQQTYFLLLKKVIAWAEKEGLRDWNDLKFSHLLAFLASAFLPRCPDIQRQA